MCFFWKKKRNDNKTQENKEDIELVKLSTVRNPVEAGIIESILKDNEIPYIIQETGANGYMKILTGALISPADIMVEKCYFEKAKSLTEMVVREGESGDNKGE